MTNSRLLPISIVAGLLASWPAVVLLAGTLVFRQEYFFLTYAIVSGVFWARSFIVGARMACQQSRRRTTWSAFRNLTFAWGAALVLLAVLNLTPLCVGRDNGDGRNNCTLCVIQSVASAVIFTPPMLLLEGLAAWGLGRWLSRGNVPPIAPASTSHGQT